MSLFASIWFPLGAVAVLTAAFVWLRRGFLLVGILYFLFRVFIEYEWIKEVPPGSIPIRIDLMLFAPLDLLMTGSLLIVIMQGLKK